MKNKFLLKFIAVTITLVPSLALAQTSIGTDFGQANNIGAFMILVIPWAEGIIASVAVLALIYAGYLYMTSQGEQENITTAKDIITGVILGIILLFTAQILLHNVIGIRQ